MVHSSIGVCSKTSSWLFGGLAAQAPKAVVKQPLWKVQPDLTDLAILWQERGDRKKPPFVETSLMTLSNIKGKHASTRFEVLLRVTTPYPSLKRPQIESRLWTWGMMLMAACAVRLEWQHFIFTEGSSSRNGKDVSYAHFLGWFLSRKRSSSVCRLKNSLWRNVSLKGPMCTPQLKRELFWLKLSLWP